MTDEERKKIAIRVMIKSHKLNPTPEEIEFINSLTFLQVLVLSRLLNKVWEDGSTIILNNIK